MDPYQSNLSMMFNTPIVLFLFNRPAETKKLFEVIRALQPTRLFIVADGPRESNSEDQQLCNLVRSLVSTIDWPCEIDRRFADKNIGCRHSIPDGLNWVFEQVEECIILEDDCIPDLSFFAFCRSLLDYYRNDTTIMTIGGHRFDGPDCTGGPGYFFSKYPSTWGWATWKRAWQKYDVHMSAWPALRDTNWLHSILDSKDAVAYWKRTYDQMYHGLDTWDYALTFACWLHQGLSIRPMINMITNIGFGANATHNKELVNRSVMRDASAFTFPIIHPKEIAVDQEAEDRIEWVSFSGIDKRRLQLARETIAARRK